LCECTSVQVYACECVYVKSEGKRGGGKGRERERG
jgi:hypothetical protein